MRCLVASFGSSGDFLPPLAVAAALHRRGHDVRVVANPAYAARVAGAGVELIPAGTPVDVVATVEADPSYGDLSSAGRMLDDLLAPDIAATYGVVRDLVRTERVDAVVTNDVGYGALWAAAEARVPSVVAHPSPAMWMSRLDPILIGLPVPAALRPPLTVAMWTAVGWYMTRFLRRVARRVGTAVADVSFRASSRMPAAHLGLWSPLLRGSMATDPPDHTICGWVRASGLECATLAPEVDAFLATGPAPIVVAFGSVYGRRATAPLLALAEACADVGRRCLVIGPPGGVAFPAGTLAVAAAPYDRVFPRAAVVVIHGGAGTTGEALRAGRPIVGVPFAYDQFSLCERVERLGVGVRVPVRRRGRAELASVLGRVLADDGMAGRAADLRPRFAAERDGAEVAAAAIEDMISRRSRSPSAG